MSETAAKLAGPDLSKGVALSTVADGTMLLNKTSILQIVRLVIPAGKDIATHQSEGEITVQCLEGRVTFTAGNRTQELQPGQLLYLSSREPHSLHGIEDASVLVTKCLP